MDQENYETAASKCLDNVEHLIGKKLHFMYCDGDTKEVQVSTIENIYKENEYNKGNTIASIGTHKWKNDLGVDITQYNHRISTHVLVGYDKIMKTDEALYIKRHKYDKEARQQPIGGGDVEST
jgi:hypothetical protein